MCSFIFWEFVTTTTTAASAQHMMMHHKCAYIAIDDCRHNENNSAIILSNVCRSCKRIREYVWCIAVSLWMHHIGRQLGNKITKHALDSPINKQAIIRCRSAIFNILKCCMSWPTNQPTNRPVYLSICRFLSLFLPFAHYSLYLSHSLFIRMNIPWQAFAFE